MNNCSKGVSNCNPGCTLRNSGPNYSYRSPIYHPDPRFQIPQSSQNFPFESSCKQFKNGKNGQTLYNMPKKPVGGYSDQMENYNSNDSIGDDRFDKVYKNFKDPNIKPCLPKPRTYFTCKDCGCTFADKRQEGDGSCQRDTCETNKQIPQEEQEQENQSYCQPPSQTDNCSSSQNPNPILILQVDCKPECKIENGRQITYFRFKIQNKEDENPECSNNEECECPTSNSPSNSRDNCPKVPNNNNNRATDACNTENKGKDYPEKSSCLSWNCGQAGCPCRKIMRKADNNCDGERRSEGEIKNNDEKFAYQTCTIPGENGNLTSIPCHHCFYLDEPGQKGRCEQKGNGCSNSMKNRSNCPPQRFSFGQNMPRSGPNVFDGCDHEKTGEYFHQQYDFSTSDQPKTVRCTNQNRQTKKPNPRRESDERSKPITFKPPCIQINDENVNPKKRNPERNPAEKSCSCLCHNFAPGMLGMSDEEVSRRRPQKQNGRNGRHTNKK